MARFYYLHASDEDERSGFARGTWDPSIDRQLRGPIDHSAWAAPKLTLEAGEFVDFMPNSQGLRLCSRRLRNVIESHTSPADGVLFLDAPVLHSRDGLVTPFFVLHFSAFPDVLHSESIWAADGDVLVKPVLDSRRVELLNVFGFEKELVRTVVSESIRDAIVDARCTNIVFSEVAQR